MLGCTYWQGKKFCNHHNFRFIKSRDKSRFTTQKMKSSVKVSSITVNKSAGTAQKMKFSLKDFFSKCDKIRSLLRIWSHLLKKSLKENFIFCAVRRLRIC